MIPMSSVGGAIDSPQRFNVSRVDGGCLLKLHGSLRIRRDQPRLKYARSHSALGATLDAIGRGTGSPGLEPAKENCVRAAIEGRLLVVIGYSGSDDFDVLPSLGRTLEGARGVIWIKHVRQRRPHILQPTDMHIPGMLRGRDDSVVITGLTPVVLREVLGASIPDDDTAAARPDVAANLLRLRPYDTFRDWHRAVIIARLAEIATQPCVAAKYYAAAAKLASRDNGDARARSFARGYAFARLGHIQREAGENVKALRSLHAARKIAGMPKAESE